MDEAYGKLVSTWWGAVAGPSCDEMGRRSGIIREIEGLQLARRGEGPDRLERLGICFREQRRGCCRIEEEKSKRIVGAFFYKGAHEPARLAPLALEGPVLDKGAFSVQHLGTN